MSAEQGGSYYQGLPERKAFISESCWKTGISGWRGGTVEMSQSASAKQSRQVPEIVREMDAGQICGLL